MQKGRGLGWVVTAFFIVADMVGAGIVAMPVAFVHTGLWIGIIFMFVITTLFAHTAHLLGQNWVIMQQRWPVYRSHCRKPYAEIAARSMGSKMKMLASVIVYLTMFGTSVVYILLSSKIIEHFLASFFNEHINFCYLVCVVVVAIMPLTYLKSPADFWLPIVIAMLCTILAVGLIAVGISMDVKRCMPEAYYPESTVSGATVSLGTFLFAFCGHQVFPTIQHDMSQPKHFTRAVVLGFAIATLLSMPLSVYGYLTYGSSMHSSVVDSVQTPWIRHTANLAIAVHCVLAIIIMVNPLNQQAEHSFHAPQTFGVQRVLIRTGVLGSMLLSALTIPKFGPFMKLVGATTNPIVCIVLPTLTNLYLNAMDPRSDMIPNNRIPTFWEVITRTNSLRMAWNMFLIAIAIIGGAISAYLALQEIWTVDFTPPCYIRPFLDIRGAIDQGDDTINCCGVDENIFGLGNGTEMCRSRTIWLTSSSNV